MSSFTRKTQRTSPTPEELAAKNINRKFRATTLEAAINTLTHSDAPFTADDVMKLADRYSEYIYKGSEAIRNREKED